VRLTTDAPLAIFRYRPKASTQGAVSVSVGNDGMLGNPAPAVYTVSGVAPTATGYTITGPTKISAGQAAQYTVSLVPAGAVPPATMDAIGGLLMIGVTDGASNGTFAPASIYPMKGSVLLSADRTQATLTYTPAAAGTVTLTAGTRFDAMPAASGLSDPAPINVVVAP
jgi:hypothetical protein